MSDMNFFGLQKGVLLLPETLEPLLPQSLSHLYRSLKSNKESEQPQFHKTSMYFQQKACDGSATLRIIPSLQQQGIFSPPQSWKNQKERLDDVHQIYSQNNGLQRQLSNEKNNKTFKNGIQKEFKDGNMNSAAPNESIRIQKNNKLKDHPFISRKSSLNCSKDNLQSELFARGQPKEQDSNQNLIQSDKLNKIPITKKKFSSMESAQYAEILKNNEPVKQQEGTQKGKLYYPPVWLKRPKDLGNSKTLFAFLKNPNFVDFSASSVKTSCNVSGTGLPKQQQADKIQSSENIKEKTKLKETESIKKQMGSTSKPKENSEKMGSTVIVNSFLATNSDKFSSNREKNVISTQARNEEGKKSQQKYVIESSLKKNGNPFYHKHFFSTHHLPSEQVKSPSRKDKFRHTSQNSLQTSGLPNYKTEASEIGIEDSRMKLSQEITQKSNKYPQIMRFNSQGSILKEEEESFHKNQIQNQHDDKQQSSQEEKISENNPLIPNNEQINSSQRNSSLLLQNCRELLENHEKKKSSVQQKVKTLESGKEQYEFDRGKFKNKIQQRTNTQCSLSQIESNQDSVLNYDQSSIISKIEDNIPLIRLKTSQAKKRVVRGMIQKNESQDSLNFHQNQSNENSSWTLEKQEDLPKLKFYKHIINKVDSLPNYKDSLQSSPRNQQSNGKMSSHEKESLKQAHHKEDNYSINQQESNSYKLTKSSLIPNIFHNNYLNSNNSSTQIKLKDTNNYQKDQIKDPPSKKTQEKIIIYQEKQQYENDCGQYFNSDSFHSTDHIPITISRCGKKQVHESQNTLPLNKVSGSNLHSDFLSLFSQ